MAVTRRRSGNNYVHAASAASHGHPETVHPPEGYCLVEADLHRATTSLEVASFHFLSQLKLRSAINLSAEPLHEKALEFFRSAGVTMLNPRSLESFDGPYDLWEEAAKEALELVLDAANQPMILLDSRTECESACLVGCLRRLQHWSVCAIHDEYHMMTMRNTQYNTSQRYIERFDLDLVTLKANVPRWYREHLTMLEEERVAEEEVYRRDPERPRRAWTHGFCPLEEEVVDGDVPADRKQYDHGRTAQNDVGNTLAPTRSESDADSYNAGNLVRARTGVVGEGGSARQGMGGREAGEAAERGGHEEKTTGAVVGAVPEYRLNGFVHVCPLVSTGCKFTAKAWLQDEDD